MVRLPHLGLQSESPAGTQGSRLATQTTQWLRISCSQAATLKSLCLAPELEVSEWGLLPGTHLPAAWRRTQVKASWSWRSGRPRVLPGARPQQRSLSLRAPNPWQPGKAVTVPTGALPAVGGGGASALPLRVLLVVATLRADEAGACTGLPLAA